MSIKRILIWFGFLTFIAFGIISMTVNPNIAIADEVYKHMTSMDIMLFRMSGCLFFFIIAAGLFVELDDQRLKNKVPLIKDHKPIKHVAYWIVVIALAIIIMNIPLQFMSDDYKNASYEYNIQEIR